MRLSDSKLYLRLAKACLAVIKNPQNINDVLAISHQLHSRFDKGISIAFFSSHPQTTQALSEKPLPLPLDSQLLAHLPEHSMGASLIAFLKTENVDPNDLVDFKSLDIKNLDEYILEHFLQTHDIWHVATGFGTDVASELGLQGFYAAQGPSLFPPLIIILGLLNAIIFKRQEAKPRLYAISTGFMMGKKAKMLFGHDWSKVWALPLSKVRSILNIEPWQGPLDITDPKFQEFTPAINLNH